MRRRRRLFFTVLIVSSALLAFPQAHGADDDDTLRYFLSKSTLVVAGTIASEPFGFSGELGVVGYTCDFTVTEVLKGKAPDKKTFKLSIGRFELAEDDKLPFLKKGGKCILFLRSSNLGWGTIDYWFGIQRYGSSMAMSLRRVAEEEAKREKQKR